jgi:hypothetical protein
MRKVTRQFFIELLWLAISLGLTTLLARFFFGRTFLTGKLDIHLRDTYFLVSPMKILLLMFLLVTFIIYFLKGLRNSFRVTLSNWILAVIGLGVIIGLTSFVRNFSQHFTGGWTAYPPLSALGPGKVRELTQQYPISEVIANFLMVIQLVILIMLLFVTYRWGIKKRKVVNA